ncbi:MAG TPA: hypothetical protein VFA68_16715 [Terriglobales bacterium]|nr:hypothetical protein [Terriglobales bacterium]
MSEQAYFGSLSSALNLRRELSHRNQLFARKRNLAHRNSYGELPIPCYVPSEDDSEHGNFLPETYRAILQNPDWRRRLNKVHAQARTALPREDRRWRELDSCTSSDALLMNVFCFPGSLAEAGLLNLLGVEGDPPLQFGFKARVPLANGKFDRTEVDLRIGDLLIEAKLTETDFQSRQKAILDSYRHFAEVFDRRSLPVRGDRYLGYQLIRNVLGAYANQCSFCVMADARRPDLREGWYAVMRCVKSAGLRVRCKMITWQELSEALPPRLQEFLREKYGIGDDSLLGAPNFD